MAEKTYKTYRQLVTLLRNRGMVIGKGSQGSRVMRILENENYYNVINGYKELFIDILDSMEINIIREKVASVACKAAVKGNRKMTMVEANALIEELLDLKNPYNCPHGRPTIISMSKTELEKKFKRIV